MSGNNELEKILAFVLETEKLKNIYRQTYVLHEDRKENDAEHSFHLAIMTALLAEYSNEPIDVLKTMKMVLIHDVVEIDAGDTYCYDPKGALTKSNREVSAAERLFGLLPDDMKDEYRGLWDEFERRDTPESKFAVAMDRLQPILLNVGKEGLSWKEHGIAVSQVEQRIAPVKNGSEALWSYIKSLLDFSLEKGWLKP